MSTVANILCRHCFILDENNTVIDPTIFTADRDDIESKKFYTIYVFDNVSEYLKALDTEGRYPELYRYLKNYDKLAQDWVEECSFMIIK